MKLHPTNGLNSTVSVCFWCGKDKNEVALLGASYKEEAPRRSIVDYNPCESCESSMSRGVTIIEALNLVPTGRWCVITKEAFHKCFNTPMTPMVLVDPESWAKLMPDDSEIQKAAVSQNGS